jgi:5-methylcytosine-specific restriction endonuclease McrA
MLIFRTLTKRDDGRELRRLISSGTTRHVACRENAQPTPSRMRLQVLRRDNYRCRRCNQTGDEITLEVRQIQPGSSSIKKTLTLCAQCRDVVERSKITTCSSSNSGI